MKKIFSILTMALFGAVTFAIGLTACSIGIYDDSPKGIIYKLNDDGASYFVAGFEDPDATEATIPAEHEGKPVTGIGGGTFSNHANLKKVTISQGILSIGDAFRNCPNLESVSIPDSVESVSNAAFLDSNKIRKTEDGVAYAVNWLLYCDRDAKDVTVKEGTKGIAAQAFYQCKKLTKVTLPSGLLFIAGSAFFDCHALSEASIPGSVKYIGAYAFWQCYALTGTITIPSGVTKIEACTFNGCSRLSGVMLPAGLTAIGKQAFDGCGIKNIVIPACVTEIGQEAFKNCKQLTHVTLPASLTSVGKMAFGDCALTSVTFTGTKTQWEAITGISDLNGSVNTVHCADGDIVNE